MAHKAFKFRLYPNAQQEQLIAKTFGCCRFIYNKMLSDRIAYYEGYQQSLKNTPAQYKGEFQFLKEVDSTALVNEQQFLNAAYNNFFRNPGKTGYPKYKSKKADRQSYTANCINSSIKVLDSKHIQLPKLGSVKIDGHREIPKDHIIKTATISKHSSGKYYISITTEYELIIPKVQLDPNKSIGLDYSSPDFYVDNQNISPYNHQHFYREAETKLAKEQRKLSHMCPKSKNYLKQKAKIAKLHEHIANQRKDFIEKLSFNFANTYDIVCLEDINLKGMAQSLNLGKSTMDNGFGMFRARLTQKMEAQGKIVYKVDKWFPSSKLCSHCGTLNSQLTLKDREWKCACGKYLKRDENAANNLRLEGLRQLGFSI